MLTAAVYAIKRFFMQQANKTMTQSNTFHELHHQLVMVRCYVGSGEDRCQLVLCRSNFVMLGFSKYAQLPQLIVQILHEGKNSLFDNAEVVVVQLLATRRFRTEKGTTGVNQVFTFFPHFFIYEEIFLFRTNSAVNADSINAEQLQQLAGCFAGCIHGTQQRSLFIQHFAGVGAEGCRNAQAVIFDKCIGGRVPCCIAAGFKGCTQTAGREAGSIGFALNQLFAGEVHDNTAFSSRRNEAFMLFSSDAGHRLEPMGEMSAAMLQSPVLHSIGDDISNFQIQWSACQHCCLICLIGCSRQTILHNAFVKN